jgi:hypothetical protein
MLALAMQDDVDDTAEAAYAGAVIRYSDINPRVTSSRHIRRVQYSIWHKIRPSVNAFV